MEIKVDNRELLMLEDFFQGLSTINQRKIFNAGFRRAAKPLVAAAKANSPFDTGTLRKSFGTIQIPSEIAIIVGAKKSGRYKGWHGHLVENGTVERFRKLGGTTGKVRGTHFFEAAYEQTQEGMFQEMEKAWYEEIDRFIIRVNKRK